jgi:ABC-type glycerol-3-phosphate transport system substrate-binding protein
MSKRMFTFFLFFILLSSNILFAQQEKTQIRWFIQATTEEGGLDTVFMQYVNAYNQSQDSIELIMDITTATCSFDAADTLLDRIAKGNPPDITSLPYSALWDHFLDLTPYLNNYDLSQMDTSYFHKFRNNSGLVYLPIGYATYLLYYNKDMFDSAGVPYPPHSYDSLYADGEPWTMEKLAQIGALLTIDRSGHNANHAEFDPNNIVQYGFHWAWSNGIAFLTMFGNPQIVNPDDRVTIPQYMRNGYYWSHEGIWKNHFIPSYRIFVDTIQGNPIGSGKVAMAITGSWYCRVLNDDTTLHWDIAAIPAYDGTHNLNWSEGGFGILNTTSNPSKALAVIMAFANIIEFYIVNGPSIPTMNNLKTEVINLWETEFPGMDAQVVLDGIDYRNPLTDAEAVRYNMSAWRIMNEFRYHIWSDPNAQIDDGINYWLIPRLDSIFQTSGIRDNSLNDIHNRYKLYQNYPNPFNSSTTIKYNLPRNDFIKLAIYNPLGQKIKILASDYQLAGEHEVTFSAEGLPGGVYFCRLQGSGFTETKELVLIK